MKPYKVITHIVNYDNEHSKFGEITEVSYYDDIDMAATWYEAQKGIAQNHAGVKSYGRAYIYVRLVKITVKRGLKVEAEIESAVFGL